MGDAEKPHFLIHDNDGRFTGAHDTVFRSEHIRIIPTPFQALNADAFAELWVQTIRECLNHLLNLYGWSFCTLRVLEPE